MLNRDDERDVVVRCRIVNFCDREMDGCKINKLQGGKMGFYIILVATVIH